MAEPEVATSLWDKVSPHIPFIISFLVLTGGYVFSLGRLKEKMLTKKEFNNLCGKNQTKCSVNVVAGIAELKCLVIDLHKDQSRKIEDMDKKREDSKDANHEEIKEIIASIGRLEGHMESYTGNTIGKKT